MTTRVACIDCGTVTPIRRGRCLDCEPDPFYPCEWIGRIFADMADAPENLRGDHVDACRRDTVGRRALKARQA